MKTNINVKPVISAINAEDKAAGTVTQKVTELYSGCKTANDFRNRRAAIGKAIDESVTDKDTAKKYKARINAVLAKYILPKGMVLTERGASKRKETIAKKKGTVSKKDAATQARREAMDADSKEFVASMKGTQAAAALHDVTSIMAALKSVVEKMNKADCVAVKTRLDNLMTSVIASKK